MWVTNDGALGRWGRGDGRCAAAGGRCLNMVRVHLDGHPLTATAAVALRRRSMPRPSSAAPVRYRRCGSVPPVPVRGRVTDMKQSEPSPSELSRPDTDASSGVELRKLRYFVAVAAEANFGRAAARLCMTQPALSRQIQSLEAEIGVRLFDRDGQGARLATQAGEQFCDDAKRMLELFVAARRRARQAARPRAAASGPSDSCRCSGDPGHPGVSRSPCRGRTSPSFTRHPRTRSTICWVAGWTSASFSCRSRHGYSRSCPCS